jgi:hypothetical protein
MNHKKSDLITEWNYAKQVRQFVTLSCVLLAILACLIARLAYLANN